MRKIIVNADDFGMSAEVNRAIVEAFENNVISSTTLMANMPGFDEACELAHRHRLVSKIGLHLNLTSGYPLSSPIRRCARFCDTNGMFRARQTRFRLSKEERLAVETEIASQVKACLDRGLRPTHLDSHHHVHTECTIGAAAITIARQNRIKAIRLARNCGPRRPFRTIMRPAKRLQIARQLGDKPNVPGPPPIPERDTMDEARMGREAADLQRSSCLRRSHPETSGEKRKRCNFNDLKSGWQMYDK